MNTIFIFNDSRPTDEFRAVIALGEDSRRIARIEFDSTTHKHCQFAMGTAHEFSEDEANISRPVIATRAAVLRRYDEICGSASWTLLWLDDPNANPGCREAINRLRERHRRARLGALVSLSNSALTSILGAILDEAPATPHTTH